MNLLVRRTDADPNYVSDYTAGLRSVSMLAVSTSAFQLVSFLFGLIAEGCKLTASGAGADFL